MLEEKDIQKIGEEMGKVIEQNVIPVLDIMNKKIEKLDQRIEKLDQRVGMVEASMVTKSYLDDKLADLEGNLISKLRKEDEKINRLIEVLKDKSVLNDGDVRQLQEFQVFPRLR